MGSSRYVWITAASMSLAGAISDLAVAAGTTQLPVACTTGTCGATGPNNWVSSGTATSTRTPNTLTVAQTSNQAILNWSSFNIAQGFTVKFAQPSTSSVALNKIYDSNPSTIFGNLSANGQVFLINQNGILFGPHAAVNVNTLVASSLDLANQTFQSGILNPALLINGQPAFASDGRTYVTDLNGGVVLNASGKPTPVSVTVEQGANITSASGGRIMLLGQQVSNAGTLTSSSGQVILAAGQKAYLQASDDVNLRGLVVEVDGGGPVVNQATGTISTPTGNTSLIGLAVNQLGRISATTTVTANGSIILKAQDQTTFYNDNGVEKITASETGTLELGAHSVTSVVPDLASTATAVDAQTQGASIVNLSGHQIHLDGGASVVANGGQVNIQASSDATALTPLAATDPQSQVRIDAGATIDVSGSNITLPVAANIVSAQLRGSELADDPQQRNGALRGQTVYVDVRADGGLGTTVANVTGEIAAVLRSVGQRTAAGGTVSIQSQGDAVLAPGAVINVSGGTVSYTGGVVATTQLVAKDGSLHDIGSADPNLTYTGIVNPSSSVTHYKWGLVENFNLVGSAHYESGYVQGYDAGTVDVAARSIVLSGTLLGKAVTGPYQRSPYTPTSATALLSTQLALVQPKGGELEIGTAAFAGSDYYAPSVDVRNDALPIVVAPDTPIAGTLNTLELSTQYLTSGGFTRTAIYSNGAIDIPVGVSLDLAPYSTFSLTAPRIDVSSSITSPGGTLSLKATTVGDSVLQYAGTGGIAIGDGVNFDMSGRWVNDAPSLAGAVPVDPLAINGGNIAVSVTGAGDVLSIGDQVDFNVSAGAHAPAYKTITAGTAGGIVLTANAADTSITVGSGLVFSGYGLNGSAGGSLELAANRIEVTRDPGEQLAQQSVDFSTANARALTVADGLFAQGGFANYALYATGPAGTDAASMVIPALAIDANARINVAPSTLLLTPTWASQASGTSIASISLVGAQPQGAVPATQLTFGVYTGSGVAGVNTALSSANTGNLVVESGAQITTNPGSTVNFSSQTSIVMAGQVHDAGGTINLTVTNPTPNSLDPGYVATQGIYLIPGSILDVAGTTVLTPSAIGLRIGSVLAGGTVNLLADRGSVFAQAGALIDVSGTNAALDVRGATASGYVRETIASAGGSINIAAPESLTLAATMVGNSGAAAGTAGPAGGSLSVALSRDEGYVGPTEDQIGLPPSPDAPRTLVVGNISQTGSSSQSTLNLAPISAGGFSSLTLTAQDAIDILGGTTLNFDQSLALRAPNIVALGAAPIVLKAPTVSLGPTNVFTQTTNAASGGPASLSVQAGLIQLNGNLSLQGIGQTSLIASSDLQAVGVLTSTNDALVGSLVASGSLTLGARQIYPTTLTQYSISVADGTLKTASTGSASPVLSAGGSLTLTATDIDSAGSIVAPFGTISLNASNTLTLEPGSLVSVSGNGANIPFGETENGQDWVYYLTNLYYQSITAPPAKNVSLSAPKVTIASGAKVDISGGGNLFAYEFIPGLGGSTDALSTSVSPNTYAILPGQQQYAPVDAPFDSGSTLAAGAAVYLAGIPGKLAAGTYTLLPARYALLPGAYLVTVQPGQQDLPLGQTATLANGAPVISGYFTTLGTNFQSGRTLGFAIQPGTYANQLADYTITSASTFFAAQAAAKDAIVPQLPIDAGSLVFNVQTGLALNGTLTSSAATGGRGALVDISAQEITITSNPSTTSSGVELAASSLQGLGAQSLLIGGTRSTAADGSEIINVLAQDTVLAAGTTLSGSEVLLVGQNSVTVGAGASLIASGTATKVGGGALTLSSASGSTALARVSSGNQVQLVETAPNASAGTVTVADGAVLSAPGSITLAGTQNTVSLGTLQSEGSVSLSSSQISLGDVAAGTGGLVLTNAQLATLGSVSDLELISASSIDFYGTVGLGTSSAPGKFSLGSLVLDGAAVRGFGTGAVTLNAGAVQFTDSQTSPTAVTAGTGTGALQVAGNRIELGTGSYALSGFQNVALASRGDLMGSGAASITVGGDLTLAGNRIVGASGADINISATGNLVTQAAALDSSLPVQTAGLGVIFNISANSIDHGGSFVLPSGALVLVGNNGLALETHSTIDVAGTVQTLASYSVSTPGGAVLLESNAGNVSMASGASINLSGGAGGGSAGTLSVLAGGTADLGGTLTAQAAAGSMGGSFTLQAQQIGNFSALVSTLSTGGFAARQDFATSSGDLTLAAGSTITAQNVALTASGGALTVNGTIDARASDGGSVALNSAGNLMLGTASLVRVDATGATGSGGTVELNTEGGSLATLAGGSIMVGGAGGGGQVIFRAPGVAGNDVAITGLGGSIDGAGSVLVRVLSVYSGVSTVDASVQGQIGQDLADFATTAANVSTRLGENANPLFSVQPAVELRSAGDMNVTDGWDLSTFRPNGVPGELTLRAAGNLLINGTLSDGLSNSGGGALLPLAGPSWSYRLAAGADFTSANPNATLTASQVVAGSGNVVIGSGVAVRTGEGSIDVNAAANVQFTDQTSVLYTSGAPVANLAPVAGVGGTFNWTTGGGDIRLNAGQDVIGAVSDQVVTAWQLRRTVGGVAQWGINFDTFQENVGALGGGNVSVTAGRDVIDLSAVVPTSGITDPVSDAVTLYGGGNLNIAAGRNLTSGVYYVGNGVGTISARGSIAPDQTVQGVPLGTILALGSGSFNVTAGNGLEIESIVNPTVLGQTVTGARNLSTFFTYSPTSSVSLTSLGGNALIEGNDQSFVGLLNSAAAANNGYYQETYLPGSLTIAALSGDINLQTQAPLYLYPSDQGQLVLAAENNLELGTLTEAGISPSLLPGPANPSRAATALGTLLSSSFGSNPDNLHGSNLAPAVFIAAQGDIVGSPEGQIQVPSSAQFIAGRDITDVTLAAENLSANDVTLFQAGRDITYSSNTGGINLGGPGYLDILAGRNVDLGASNGITTLGTTQNPTLPGTSGATVNLLTGLTVQPAYQAFINKYFVDDNSYSAQLVSFISSITGSPVLNANAALTDFDALPTLQQLPLILTAFFNELNQAGLEATAGQKPGYARGFAAIDALFPGSLDSTGKSVSASDLPYSGDLSLSFSRIYTVAGGDINLLVPGGLVNVGLANPPPNAPSRLPSQLGIVTQGPGSINAFTYGDVDVNQSRAFTLDGGDILIWSSTGNIDAGRGAKTAISAPAPTITVDPNTGQVSVDLTGAVAGSGIRTIQTDPTVKPGDVNLIAPVGTVDAGDAGIGSAGNINIAAAAVLGATNINFGGTATGVPAATSNVAAGLTGVSNTANSASNAAVDSATKNSAVDKTSTMAEAALGWLDVFVTGLGDENCKPDDMDCLKRARKP